MTVIIPKKVYQTIVAASVRYANARIPEDDWLEVYGIFIGKIEGEDVLISAAPPITHQVKREEDVIDKVFCLMKIMFLLQKLRTKHLSVMNGLLVGGIPIPDLKL